MTDVFPVDHTSDVGRVRKYIPDLVPLENTKDPSAPKEFYFSDVEIAGFLYEYSGDQESERWDVKYAAADAIDALANNEALVLKKIKTEDLQTDGPATASALRAGARALREQAKAEEQAHFDSEVAFVPFKHYHPKTRLPRRF